MASYARWLHMIAAAVHSTRSNPVTHTEEIYPPPSSPQKALEGLRILEKAHVLMLRFPPALVSCRLCVEVSVHMWVPSLTTPKRWCPCLQSKRTCASSVGKHMRNSCVRNTCTEIQERVHGCMIEHVLVDTCKVDTCKDIVETRHKGFKIWQSAFYGYRGARH